MSLVRFRMHMVIPLLATLAAPAARAADSGNWWSSESDNPWKVAIFGGDSVALRGSLLRPEDVTIPNLGALDAALNGRSASLSMDRLKYDDIFRRQFDAGLEMSYSFSPELEAFGNVSYGKLDGRSREVGALTTGTSTTPVPLMARFSDLNTWSMELGSRFYLPTGTAVEPFVGAALGLTHLQAIRARFDIPSEALAVPNVNFTDASTEFMQSVQTGVEFHSTPNLDLRLAVEAEHINGPGGTRDPNLAALGLGDRREPMGQWNFPVTLGVAYHF